ncbi:HlyD family secretion protein [Paenibacillus sp. SGZ-1009]|uniref:HlyD family secretion protein n=1 Tax=Paenibacillus campi TaxID=3106031 RepID=UPI002AFE7E3B|nr:biotin/lipoyl-binding protein [Paenibacillus sp. SGZ-1009]
MKIVKLIPIIVLIVALGVGGTLLAMHGKDAVSMAALKKEGVLTIDTVNSSFEGQSGKIASVKVKEEDHVKKGQLLMTLDTQDVNLQIQNVKEQMSQLDVQISQTQSQLTSQSHKLAQQKASAQLNVQAAQVAEQKVLTGARPEDIQSQTIAVDSAKKSVEVANNGVNAAQNAVATAQQNVAYAQTSYDRAKSLFDNGLGTQASLDTAQNALNTAQKQLQSTQDQLVSAQKQVEVAGNQVLAQETALEKLQNGATAEDRQAAHVQVEQAQQALKQIDQGEEDIRNGKYNIELLQKQKQSLQINMDNLLVQKSRRVLTAPADGKVTRVVPKVGENISAGTPVVMIETGKLYYDLYVGEENMKNFQAGAKVDTNIVALGKHITGTVRYITSAPQYAALRMSREKGQADTTSFIVRVDVKRTSDLLPGMTVEVPTNESNN